jgi:hypothetical protein
VSQYTTSRKSDTVCLTSRGFAFGLQFGGALALDVRGNIVRETAKTARAKMERRIHRKRYRSSFVLHSPLIIFA